MTLSHAKEKGLQVYVVHYESDEQARKAILNGIAYMQTKYKADVTVMILGKEVTSPFMIEWSNQFDQDDVIAPLNHVYLGIPVVNIGKGVSKQAPAPPALPAKQAKQARVIYKDAPVEKASKPAGKPAKPAKRKKKKAKSKAAGNGKRNRMVKIDAELWQALLDI